MSAKNPDHHDAEIVLRLYDLRRETVMRDSRSKMMKEFWPKCYDDLKAITDMSHPLNTAMRQVSSYWEMACSFAVRGIVNADILAENSGEGIFLYCKVEPFVAQLRAEIMPHAFKNVEWITKNCQAGQERYEALKKRVAKYMEAN